MKLLRLGIALLLPTMLVCLLGSPVSAVVVRIGPKESWSEEQRAEYWLGFLSEALTHCGYYSDARALRELARQTPYGRHGISQTTGYDYYAGGCASARNDAKKVLSNKNAWKAHLESKYSCSDSGCTVRGGP